MWSSFMAINCQGKTKYSDKSAPLPLYTPQIPHDWLGWAFAIKKPTTNQLSAAPLSNSKDRVESIELGILALSTKISSP
jgi:hypothetical protein